MKSHSSVSPHLVPSMVARGEIHAEDYIVSTFERIDRLDSKVHAYLQLNREGALSKAKELDRRAKRGEKLGKLAGLGIGVKDNICVESLQATCASKILEGFRPPYSATASPSARRLSSISRVSFATPSPMMTRASCRISRRSKAPWRS